MSTMQLVSTILIPLALIIASGAMAVRNVHNYWGSWEPVKRWLRPNPLRPVLYSSRHGSRAYRRNKDGVRASSLILQLFHERAWRTAMSEVIIPAIEMQQEWLRVATTPDRRRIPIGAIGA